MNEKKGNFDDDDDDDNDRRNNKKKMNKNNSNSKPVYQSSTGHSVHMRGLPFEIKESDIYDVSECLVLLINRINRIII